MLGRRGDPKSLKVLLHVAVHDPYLHSRWKSIWALSSMNRDQVISALKQTMATTTPDQTGAKWNASVALAAFEHEDALAYLHDQLKHSEDEWKLWEGIHSLSRVNNKESLQVVYPFVTHPNAKIAAEAVLTMSKLKHVSKQYLTKVLKAAQMNAKPEVSERAKQSLDRLYRQEL
jgi:HEAT repeat protein